MIVIYLFFFKVLVSLKRKIDEFIAKQQEDSVSVLVEQARVFLISRENRLVNARKNVLEAAAQFPSPKKNYLGGDVSLSASSVSMPTARGKSKIMLKIFIIPFNLLILPFFRHFLPT